MKRIQRKRSKGWRMPENAKYVGRGTRWGNPFNRSQFAVCFSHRGFPMPLIPLLEPPSLERCIDMYTGWLYAQIKHDPEFLKPLEGKDLACWCPLDSHCHADVLIDLIEKWA